MPDTHGSFFQRLKTWARGLAREVAVLVLAMKHPGTPWPAKVVAALVVAYALSPIDLIPDFVPVLGYLDDLILLPLGIALAIRLIPAEVLEACRRQVVENPPRLGLGLAGAVVAVVIAVFWLWALYALYRCLNWSGPS